MFPIFGTKRVFVGGGVCLCVCGLLSSIPTLNTRGREKKERLVEIVLCYDFLVNKRVCVFLEYPDVQPVPIVFISAVAFRPFKCVSTMPP